MGPIYLVILAAGDSTRLKSSLAKVMHPICGRPMIDYILDLAATIQPKKTCLVLGRDREKIITHLKDRKNLIFAHQKQRLGTAHALQIGLQALNVKEGEVLVLSGDVPLLRAATVKNFIQLSNKSKLSITTTLLPDPYGYGRIIRNSEGDILSIVEEKNADSAEKQINEINAGVYLADIPFLKEGLSKIKRDPIKKEYYLTDIVDYAVQHGQRVDSILVEDADEVLGVNTRAELAYINQLRRQSIAAYHLARGVGMEDPSQVYIDEGVKIGEDSFLGQGVHLLGTTRLGKGCRIEAGCIIKNSQLADDIEMKAYSYLEDSKVGKGAVVGPFARLRPQTIIDQDAKVGNFVELKKTRLGRGSKANHLSYLGDTTIGQGVNIGAGTITCNYDGKNKFKTKMGDGVFIGSDVQLVAPVALGKGAYVAAGTTVTKDVPAGALAISRVKQQNIKGYRQRKK